MSTRYENFDDVDSSGEVAALLRLLDAIESQEDVRRRRKHTYELLALAPGAAVLEAGCGAGTVVGELAPLVAPGGRAVGVDASAALIEAARGRVSDSAVELVVGDVTALPFGDGEFDAYRAERLYQHLADPAAALAEARRVLRPGGRIVLVDQDWEAFIVDSDDAPVTRRILNSNADSLQSGWIGRRHAGNLRLAGFEAVEVVPEANVFADAGAYAFLKPVLSTIALNAAQRGHIAEAEAEAWIAEQQARAAGGRFFASMTHFIAHALRP